MTAAYWILKLVEPTLPLGRHVPFVCQRVLIESLVARVFAEPVADGAFEILRGRWLRLEVSDLGLAWCLGFDGVRLQLAERAVADACIRGSWRDFLLLASRQEDPDTLFFRRRLIVEGDTELGLGVKNLLDSIDPEGRSAWPWRLLQALGEQLRSQ